MIRLTKALAVAAVVVLTIPSIASALGISIISSSLPDGGTLERILAHVAAGDVETPLDRSFSLASVAEAHEYLEVMYCNVM